MNGFEDVISIGGNSDSCVFQTDQTFSLGSPRGVVSQVGGKNCVGTSDSAMCRQQATHTGWHVSAAASSVTVTDIP